MFIIIWVMAWFDYHVRGDQSGYLVNIQSDLMEHLPTRMVVLLPLDQAPPALGRLNLVFEIKGRRHVFLTHLMAAVPTEELGLGIGTLTPHKEAIERAIHMVFYGF